MGKFGKKVEISTNPLDYNICILGESKIGKTTIAKQMCEKLVGDDGYIHLDIGREEGAAAIEGIVSEHIGTTRLTLRRKQTPLMVHGVDSERVRITQLILFWMQSMNSRRLALILSLSAT